LSIHMLGLKDLQIW